MLQILALQRSYKVACVKPAWWRMISRNSRRKYLYEVEYMSIQKDWGHVFQFWAGDQPSHSWYKRTILSSTVSSWPILSSLVLLIVQCYSFIFRLNSHMIPQSMDSLTMWMRIVLSTTLLTRWRLCVWPHLLSLMTTPYSTPEKTLLENLGICLSDNGDKRKASVAGPVRLFMIAGSCKQH